MFPLRCDDVLGTRKVGLPGTVEAHESVGGVPESVWTKVQTVKQGGGGLAELKEKVSSPRRESATGWLRRVYVFCSLLLIRNRSGDS